MSREEQDRFRRVRGVFEAALEQDPGQRAAFLARACGSDEDLRSRVDALLAADERTSLVDEPAAARLAAGLAAGLLARDAEPSAVGRRVGAHRLLREIGRGGMGTIYLARRDDGQYQEQVAIKLVKRGMDSEAILGRFRRERQILANLHHPNIAQLLDGGVTEDGSPYFVMEYIDGVPIDRYCDAHQLAISARLELLRTVCDAVQSAHRRLVVHCDLKPSNILVTADGVPKLLDFGIARLLVPQSVEGTVTRTASRRPMTPEYASPEQIRGQALTTSSDVYSLAVVLYELLTGRRPHRLAARGHFEIERAVCEQEPDKPSTAVLRTEPSAAADKLRRRLTGDLDNIVLMALAKQPEQRYGSVEQLSEDLRRHLEGLPVQAHKPTLSYRAGKFLRRHRLAVSAALMVLVTLVGGIVATAHQAREARLRGLTAERALDFVMDLFVASDPDEGAPTLSGVLDEGASKIRQELVDEPLPRSALMTTLGEVYRKLSRYDDAEPLLQEALATRRQLLGNDHADVATTLHYLGTLRDKQARHGEAEELLSEALEIRLRLFGEERALVADTLNNLGLALKNQERYEEAEALNRRALELRRRLLGEEHLKVSTSLNNLAMVLRIQGEEEEAERRFRQVLDMRRRLLGHEHPRVATSLNNLARLLKSRGEEEEAEALYRQALALQRKLLGRHRHVASTLINLGALRDGRGDHAGAEALFLEALEMFREFMGNDHPFVAESLHRLARVIRTQGRDQEAEPLLREALEIFRRRADPLGTARSQGQLGACLSALGRFEEAEALLLESLSTWTASEGPDEPRPQEARRRLAELYEAWGQHDAARRHRLPDS